MYQIARQRLQRLIDLDHSHLMRNSRIGLEKECLRVNKQGSIAQTPHPRTLGAALTHPYITTDYAEALIEFITPPYHHIRQALDFLQNIKAPVLSLMATPDAPWSSEQKTAARKKAIAHGRYETIAGHHHFHMDIPEQIAETIQSFILANDTTPSNRGQNEQPD